REGQLTAAERTLRDAVQVRTKVYGPEHWAVAQVQSLLGEVLVRDGKTDEGRQLLRSSLERLTTALGAEHERTKQAQARLQRPQAPVDKICPLLRLPRHSSAPHAQLYSPRSTRCQVPPPPVIRCEEGSTEVPNDSRIIDARLLIQVRRTEGKDQRNGAGCRIE